MAFDGRLLPGIGVLAQVVETGNFARAGEAIGLTPSGVSRAVARLEARLGVRLFDRTPPPRKPADLLRHECLLFRDPVSGKPFDWEFRRKGEVIDVAATGRVVFNDLQTKLAACVAGQGIAQSVAFGLEQLLAAKQLVQVLPDWAEERYALYSYYPSRHLPPAKVRAFLDFLLESVPAKKR